MTGNDWITGPIWEVVCPILDIRPIEENISALAIYTLMEERLLTGGLSSELADRLSPSQYNSLRIIHEWWACSIEEDQWFSTTADREKHLEILRLFPIIDQAYPLTVQIMFGIGSVLPQISTYRLEGWRLFQMEFDTGESAKQDRATYLGFLQKQRERAAFYSSVQRTTFACRDKIDKPHNSSKIPSHRLSELLDSRSGIFSSSAPIGACIEACPWLKFRKQPSGLPFYLWDTNLEKTVEVETIATKPKYFCISHTWGRWRTPKISPIPVSGVPWLVPQNTLFEVQDLPKCLKRAFPNTYVWLDLFCIPQDGSERSLIEISRQADIFGNAMTVVAWLNDIDSWEGLGQTTEWLCKFCLDNYGGIKQPEPTIDASQSTGLVIPNSNADDEHSHVPGNWFTSLWTLQEACLRPDILLCSRDFELFGIGEECSTFVSLDSLAALVNFTIFQYDQGPYETILNFESRPENMKSGTVREFDEINKASPKRKRWILETLPTDAPGVVELYDALVMSGMNSLFKASPASILNLGQHRECTSRRAEAIMSVLGATTWYKTHVEKYKSSPAEDNLVAGCYPVAFLDEVKNNLRAQFFASVSSSLSILEGVVNIEGDNWVPEDVSLGIGSLLPFTSTQTTLVLQEHISTSTCDHPSVGKWTILPGGEVKIEEAGILSSSCGNFESEIYASILIPGIYSTSPDHQSDLHEWVRNFRPGPNADTFAVSLYQATQKFQWGLILKEVGPGRLVKIGTFFTDAVTVEQVPSQIVDWIVL